MPGKTWEESPRKIIQISKDKMPKELQIHDQSQNSIADT